MCILLNQYRLATIGNDAPPQENTAQIGKKQFEILE